MKRLFSILEYSDRTDKIAQSVSIGMMTLIVLNICAVILETVQSVGEAYSRAFYLFEIMSVTIFSIEYLLRVISFTKASGVSGGSRLRYIFSPMMIIDLIAILPFYIPILFAIDLRFVRALRLLRLTRLFKLGRYTESMRIIKDVLKLRREELIICLFAALILLIVASGGLYFIEKDVQPEAFSSIPASMWWGVATLTTVGYGDVYPITALGKFLGAIIALLGVGMFALPAGIIASGFAEAVRNKRVSKCPHCGEKL